MVVYLGTGLSYTAEKLNEILKKAKLQFQAEGHDFIDNIDVLGEALDVYASLYKRTGFANHEAIEKCVPKCPKVVQDAAEDLLEAEQEWRNFLSKVQEKVKQPNSDGPLLGVGDKLPLDLQLMKVPQDEPYTLQVITYASTYAGNFGGAGDSSGVLLPHPLLPMTAVKTALRSGGRQTGALIFLCALKSAGVSPIVVGFGDPAGAVSWQKQTGCPLPYFRSHDRALYNTLGLKRLVENVWSSEVMQYYGSQIAKGISLKEEVSVMQVKNDPHQMGCDFIIDKTGQIIYIVRPSSPVARPSLDSIISAAREHSS